MTSATHHQRGTVMVIVLGLITIMVGLLLTVTVTVHQGIRATYDYNSVISFFLQNKPAYPKP
jgi:hypothetical protein